MLRHRWKILTGIALAFVLLTGIKLATIGDGPQKEVEAYRKSLIAKGEKLEISELIPPPVPQEQNGADVMNEAFSMMTPDDYQESNLIPAMRLIAPGKAIVSFEQPDVRDRRFTNSWANESAVVGDDGPMTELLKQAVNYPAIDFHLDYEGNGVMDAQPVSPLRWSANRLSAEAMCDLRRGNAAAAETNICAILAFINGQQDERRELFQVIRINMSSIAADATWASLQSSNVNDAELAMVQGRWERLEFIHAMENTLLMQRAWFESEIPKMLASDDYFKKEMGHDEMSVDWSDGLREGFNDILFKSKLACSKSMYRASWIYWDESKMLQNYQIALETLRAVETNGVFNPFYNNMAKRLKASAADEPNDWLVNLDETGLRRSLSSYSGDPILISLTMGAEATRRMAVTAIALKRYQLKHGKYPASLSDLIPEFVSSVPQDPVDGKPMRYRLMPDGSFLLYSIGRNDKDDGGDGSRPGTRGANLLIRWNGSDALDWVWPQPATAAEIQDFYAHPEGP